MAERPLAAKSEPCLTCKFYPVVRAGRRVQIFLRMPRNVLHIDAGRELGLSIRMHSDGSIALSAAPRACAGGRNVGAKRSARRACTFLPDGGLRRIWGHRFNATRLRVRPINVRLLLAGHFGATSYSAACCLLLCRLKDYRTRISDDAVA